MAKFSREALRLLRDKILLFDGLIDEQLSMLLNVAKKRNIGDGELLINEGALSTRMYIVISGQAIVTRRHKSTHERLAVLEPGSTVGEMGIIDCAPRSARVVANGPTVVLEIDQEVLDSCSADVRGLLYKNLSVILARRLRGANLMMESMAANESDSDSLSHRIQKLGMNDWSLSRLSAQRVDLTGADLQGADLRGADLRAVDLRGADLRGALFDEADLRSVDLDGAIMDDEVIGASENDDAHNRALLESLSLGDKE